MDSILRISQISLTFPKETAQSADLLLVSNAT
jgi:hypothetical protein